MATKSKQQRYRGLTQFGVSGVAACSKALCQVRRPLKVAGWHTGITLEDAFWDAMQEITVAKGTTRSRLVTQIK